MTTETLAGLDPNETLTSLVICHPEYARILQRYDLEFCCEGEQTLAVACRRRQIPLGRLLAELQMAERHPPGELGARSRSPQELAASVQAQHEALSRTLPDLVLRARKLADGAGPRAPWLKELAWQVADLANAVRVHFDYEDDLLERAGHGEDVSERFGAGERFGFEETHSELGDLLADLHLYTEGFGAGPDASPEERSVMAELDALEGRLMQTVHLENHLLFPTLG